MSLNNPNCWQILGIEQTDDKKLIKRTYHKLLRLNKPDENPKGFQIVYQAYQNALEGTNQLVNLEKSSAPDRDNDDTQQSKQEELLQKEIIIEKSNNINENQQQKSQLFLTQGELDLSKFYQQSAKNLRSVESFNNIENWHFMDELNLKYSIEARNDFSRYLFDSINHLDKKFSDQLLSSEVIVYLDSIFMWSKYWNNYNIQASIFEYMNIMSLKELIQQTPASRIQRLRSILIDVVAVSLFLTLISFLTKIQFSDLNIKFFLFISILFFLLIILLNVNKTLGQYLTHLTLLEDQNSYLKKPSIIGIVIRVILTMVSAYTAAYFLINPFNFSVSMGVVILNLYLFATRGLLVQDLWATKLYGKKNIQNSST